MPIEPIMSVLVLALVVEAAFGYSDRIYDWIGHPVTWLGALISTLDGALNRGHQSSDIRRAAGALTLAVIVAIAAGIAWVLESALASHWAGNIVLALLASTMLASRSLYYHVRDVANALTTEGLPVARYAVSRIVGRDPQTLDEHGVARAAIESLAENASDGVVAPAFWFLVLGLPGLAAYKAINTADSMIGHRTPRHEAFGWAAARFDDLVNLPASRLTGLLFAAAAALVPGADPKNAWRALRRDSGKHRSPNAGWPEAAMAGALGLALAGPRVYGGMLVEDHMMGDGRREATAADIRRALRLYHVADGLLIGLFGML